MRLRGVVCVLPLVVAAGCGGSSSPTAPVTAAPTTQGPPVVVTTPPSAVPTPTVTDLSVGGYSPGVEQAPFYPSLTVSAVACGTTGASTFVRIDLPAGQSGTPSGSALAEATTIVVVPGKAVLKDHTGKILYEEDLAAITTARSGTLVLSLTNTTSTGGAGRSVASGALDISGDYACPAASVPFPGT